MNTAEMFQMNMKFRTQANNIKNSFEWKNFRIPHKKKCVVSRTYFF